MRHSLFFSFFWILGLANGWSINLEDFEIFQKPSHIAVSPSGKILFSVVEEGKLYLMDSNGVLLKSQGRPGQGPGEFQRINGLAWNESLSAFLVHDSLNTRISAFSEDITLQKEWTIKTFINRPVEMTDTSIFVLRDNNGEKGAEPYVLQVNYHTNESTYPYEYPTLDTQYGLHFDDGGFSMFRCFDWDPQLLFALGDGFFVTSFNHFQKGNQAHFTIHHDGNARQIKSTLKATPLSPGAVDEVLSQYPNDLLPYVKKHLVAPKLWPAILRIIVVNNQIYVFGPPAPKVYPFEVYSPSGKFLGGGSVPFIPQGMSKDAFFFTEDRKDGVFLLKNLKKQFFTEKP